MHVSQCSGSLVVEPGVQGSWAPRSRFLDFYRQAQWLWPIGLAAPRHVGSSWTRDATHVSALADRFFTIREALPCFLFCFAECSLQVPLRTQLLGSKEFKPQGETTWELRSELSQPEHRYMLVKNLPYCVRPHSFLSP